MAEEENRVPVYLITGFLESGKTRFLSGVVQQEYFQIDETTLILVCEDGEETYDGEELARYGAVVRRIDEQEELNGDTLRVLESELHPGRVMVEYNPLWSVRAFEKLPFPEGWGIEQEIVVVDASTYAVYRTNMKSLFVEMFAQAELVVFNRCREDQPLAEFRRGIKVTNPACEIAFEDRNGEPIDLFADSVPYDLDAEVITIGDADYGIFYVDLEDNPDRYEGRTVRFRGKIHRTREMGGKYFELGWNAMTCCAEDIQYIGYICESPQARTLANGSWAEITAKVEIRHMMAYRGKRPVFRVMEMRPVDPPESDLVYFS